MLIKKSQEYKKQDNFLFIFELFTKVKGILLMAALVFKQDEMVGKLLSKLGIDISATEIIYLNETYPEISIIEAFPLLHAIITHKEDLLDLLLNREDINADQVGLLKNSYMLIRKFYINES